MKRLFLPVLLLAVMVVSCKGPQTAPKLVFNEVMANNAGAFLDQEEEADDWVEIYNAGDSSVNLAGMYITDDPKKPKKYQFPTDAGEETKVPGGGFKVLWLDKQPEQGPLHVDFRLKTKGETLALYTSEGVFIDSIATGKQYTGFSFGRTPTGAENWSYQLGPTPGKTNAGATASERSSKVTASLPDGKYNGPQNLTLTAPEGAKIIFTLDGSFPREGHEKSISYGGPIPIPRSMVVRTRAIEPGKLPGPVKNLAYLLDEPTKLPVLSIIVDPQDLHPENTGLHHEDNFETRAVKRAHATYFNEQGEIAFDQGMGIKLQGRYARRFAKKSWTLLAGEKWGGKKRIRYRVFPNLTIESFDGLVIRADANYAWSNRTERAHAGERIKNELMFMANEQMRQHGSNVLMQSYQPAVVYLNGEYWGLYNIMERKNKKLIHSHYGTKDIEMMNPGVKRDDVWHF
ncbi:MAG: lamin tail domain-containing protein, partial [Bacteroidota bacterium]